jgi:hypothetical protein
MKQLSWIQLLLAALHPMRTQRRMRSRCCQQHGAVRSRSVGLEKRSVLDAYRATIGVGPRWSLDDKGERRAALRR